MSTNGLIEGQIHLALARYGSSGPSPLMIGKKMTSTSDNFGILTLPATQETLQCLVGGYPSLCR